MLCSTLHWKNSIWEFETTANLNSAQFWICISFASKVLGFEGLPVLMLSHPLLLDAFPITKLGPVGEVRRPASTPHPRPTPPILEFPARALTTPHPNPPSSLISPIFRISTKADVAKSASSSYNKIQSFMHCRKYTAVKKSHGKFDSWLTFQEVSPQGAEAVSFKIHLAVTGAMSE